MEENLKETLEKKKLELEIKSLKRSIFVKNLPAFITLLIGLGSISIAYYTGFFDLKREKLSFEIAQFEQKKKEITLLVDSLQNKLDYNELLIVSLKKQEVKRKEIEQNYNNLLAEAQQIKESSTTNELKIKNYQKLISKLQASLADANKALIERTSDTELLSRIEHLEKKAKDDALLITNLKKELNQAKKKSNQEVSDTELLSRIEYLEKKVKDDALLITNLKKELFEINSKSNQEASDTELLSRIEYLEKKVKDDALLITNLKKELFKLKQ